MNNCSNYYVATMERQRNKLYKGRLVIKGAYEHVEFHLLEIIVSFSLHEIKIMFSISTRTIFPKTCKTLYFLQPLKSFKLKLVYLFAVLNYDARQ